MDSYLLLKFIHILSAAVVTGTGVGIAFFMFMANRSNNPQAIYGTAKSVGFSVDLNGYYFDIHIARNWFYPIS